MSKPDDRVVAVQRYTPALNDSDYMDGSKVASMDPYTMGGFVTYADYQKVESLLAEAEREAKRWEANAEQWRLQAIDNAKERDALQARLDAVAGLADVMRACFNSQDIHVPIWHRLYGMPDELRSAALGGESPGNSTTKEKF